MISNQPTHKEIRSIIADLLNAAEALWPTAEDKVNIPPPIAKSLKTLRDWSEKHKSGKGLTDHDIAAVQMLCSAMHGSLDTQLELRIQTECGNFQN